MAEDITETLYVACELTPEEIKEAGSILAERTQRIETLEEQKASLAKEIGAQIALAKADATIAAMKISTGREYRNVSCKVVLNFTDDKKMWFRKDNGALVRETSIPPEDRQGKLPV
jgi:hypothetical protein